MSVNIGSTAQEILNEINNKINKTTYEASAELACSSNGKVCLGKFGAYDTNITIELNSTTSKTYHATIVIWSQNVEPNATKGAVGCNVYGDADNNITPLISVFRPYGSANRQIEVYANLPGYSKNLIHIQGVAISTGGMTDVLTSVSSIPTAIDGKIKVTPINVLKSMFASKDVATTSTAGLMSAADKIKLDNVLTLASIREDSSGNVVVANDLIVKGVGYFGNDIEVAGTVKTNSIEATDYITLKSGYPIRFYSEDNTKFVDIQCNDEGALTSNGDLSTKNIYPTATNSSNLGSSSKQYNTIYGKTIYENGTALSEKYAPKSTVGADQIKGIYLTGENRTIVGAESDVGIIWEGDGTLFKDENAVTKIADTHFMTRVPIVAGNNVTFETDTENQVVKINSAGALATDTDVRVNNLTVTGITSLNGDVAIFNGNPLKLFSEGNSGSIYLRNEEGKLTVEGEAVALSSDIPTDYVDLSSAQTISGKKHFKTGSGYSTPALASMFFGPSETTGFAFGNDGLQTFSNGAYSTMYVNYYGGNVDIGRSGSTANVNLYGTVKENGVALSEKYALKSEVGSGGETDSSIIDLGEQGDHNEAQWAIINRLITANADTGCYLFKYYCLCRYDACFAVVLKEGNTVKGTVYDSNYSYREFIYSNGEVTLEGCWKTIAYWNVAYSPLDTDNKTLVGAINEINAKVGSSSGGTPTKIENGDSYVEAIGSGVDINGDVLNIIGGTISIRDADSVNLIYLDELDGLAINGSQINIETPTGNDEMARLSSDTVEIYGKSNVDLYASNGSVSINSPKGNTSIDGKTLSLRINNTNGNAGQVLMSDGTYAYWGDVSGSSGGGATLSMPRIRLANYKYDEPVFYYDESGEWEGKITFSVHIQDGTVQIGDQLQICKMGKTYNKNKLQVFMQKTITAEDIENLAKQPYLQITTDDFAGNTHGADTSDVFERLNRTDTFEINRKKPKYIRIRRPLYKGDRVVNAIFSNVVPVEFGLKFEKIYTE